MIEDITLGQVAIAGGFILSLIAIIREIIKPLINYKQIQKENEKRFEQLEEHEKKDLKRFEKYDSDLKQVLLSVDVLLQHSIDNNHIDKLKERKDELSKYLIERS